MVIWSRVHTDFIDRFKKNIITITDWDIQFRKRKNIISLEFFNIKWPFLWIALYKLGDGFNESTTVTKTNSVKLGTY
jgi:hypothetical protein